MRDRDLMFYLVALSLSLALPAAAQDQVAASSATSTMAASAMPATPASAAGDGAGVAPASVAPVDTTPHAAVDPFFQPVSPGKLKGIKVKKEKPPKTIHMTIEHAVLTVDGWTGKANLNFDIDDFQYFYMWAPGVGTVIVSNHPFAGAKIQYSAFEKNTLTVKIDDHQLQLTADHRILPGKPKEPDAPAYVAIDPGYAPTSSKYPMFGYGLTNKAPYAWPGSLLDTKANKDAPPLPTGVQPTIQTTTVCPPAAPGAPALTASGCKSVPVPMAPGKNRKPEKTASL